MVEKNYYIKTERNIVSEIQYISDTYSLPNSKRVGLYIGNILRAKLDLDLVSKTEDNLIEDMASRGATAFYIENQFIDLSLYQQSSIDNNLLFPVTQQINLNALSTSYVDIFPSFYKGLPIPIDTRGYKKMGFVFLWNKNGGTGTHTVRMLKCDHDGIITQPEHILRESVVGNGYFADFNYTIPIDLRNYVGFIKIQAKSSNGTDNPVFNGLWLYRIRR